MTAVQNTHFAQALAGWIEREHLTTAQATAYLQISRTELQRWLDGSLPANNKITAVSTRISLASDAGKS